MMGNSHALTGVVAAVITAQVFDATSTEILVGAVLVLGASLVPDLDCASSTISNTLGPVTRGLSWVIRTGTGGHRRGTHSIAGAAILAGVAQTAVSHRDEPWAISVLALIIFLCLAGPIRLLGIRGLTDDLLPLPIALGMAMWDAVPLRLAPAALFIGVCVHILGDMITMQGCPVLWPLSNDKVRLAKLRAGGWTERVILRPVFVVAIPVAACWTWIDPYWVAFVAGLAERH